jgi:antitoxin component YwqK of YwqJK toxin-antitoxin module
MNCGWTRHQSSYDVGLTPIDTRPRSPVYVALCQFKHRAQFPLLFFTNAALLVSCGCERSGQSTAQARVKREYYADRTLKMTQEYVIDADGVEVPHGKRVQYYRDGKRLAEDWFVMGTQVGVTVSWHHEGTVSEVTTFADGKRHGGHMAWYADGRMKEADWFVNGVRDGRLRQWADNGQLTADGVYVQGLPDGVCRQWYDNGHMECEQPFSKGQLDGELKWWNEDGTLRAHEMWKGGVMVRSLIHDEADEEGSAP